MPTVAPFHFEDYIEAVAFVDNQAAFACADGNINLFTDSGMHTIKAHDGLLCATLAVDGKSLITGGEDGRVIQTSNDGSTDQIAEMGSKWISCVAAGPSGAIAWASGKEAFVKAGKTDIRSFQHQRTVEDIAFAPKGLRIAAAQYNGAYLHWAGTSAPSQVLEWAGAHNMVQFSPNGKYLVTSMQENSLHGWRLTDEKHMRMSGYPNKVKSMSFSKKGKWLATSGANSAVVWPFDGKDGPMGKMPKELGQRADSLVVCVACHPVEDVVAIGYSDGMVMAVRIDDAEEALLRRPGKSAITAMAWDNTGTRLLFGSEDGEAGLVDITA